VNGPWRVPRADVFVGEGSPRPLAPRQGPFIAILPAEGRVRVRVAGKIVAESSRALRLEEKGYPPVYYLPATMRTCPCWFGPGITAIVRTR